jgi:hypothetical protein
MPAALTTARCRRAGWKGVGGAGVDIRRRRQEHQRQADFVHRAAIAAHRQRVPQFVQRLDQRIAEPGDGVAGRRGQQPWHVGLQRRKVDAGRQAREQHADEPRSANIGQRNRRAERRQRIQQARRVEQRHAQHQRIHEGRRLRASSSRGARTAATGAARHRTAACPRANSWASRRSTSSCVGASSPRCASSAARTLPPWCGRRNGRRPAHRRRVQPHLAAGARLHQHVPDLVAHRLAHDAQARHARLGLSGATRYQEPLTSGSLTTGRDLPPGEAQPGRRAVDSSQASGAADLDLGDAAQARAQVGLRPRRAQGFDFEVVAAIGGGDRHDAARGEGAAASPAAPPGRVAHAARAAPRRCRLRRLRRSGGSCRLGASTISTSPFCTGAPRFCSGRP